MSEIDTSSKYAEYAAQAKRTAIDLKNTLWWGENPLMYVAILGLAMSALAVFVNGYNLIGEIDNLVAVCAESSELAHAMNTKFWITLSLSILSLLIGSFMVFIFRKKTNKAFAIASVGLVVLGILGIIYSIVIKLTRTSSLVRFLLSIIVFIGFLVFAFYLAYKK